MKRILLCEDETEVTESLGNILRKENYDVSIAADGEQAVSMAKESNPDLILLDIRMPKIDGLEVASQIRKFNEQTKLIFITAFQSPELIKEATKYNIADYIIKPATSKNILKAVKAAL